MIYDFVKIGLVFPMQSPILPPLIVPNPNKTDTQPKPPGPPRNPTFSCFEARISRFQKVAGAQYIDVSQSVNTKCCALLCLQLYRSQRIKTSQKVEQLRKKTLSCRFFKPH